MKKQSGITLIELVIVIAIIGILAAIAVPNFGGLMRENQLKSTYNSFVGIIATARVEAVNQRTPIVLCPSANGTACDGANWSAGYIAYADTNGDNAWADGENILRHEAIPNGVTMSAFPNLYQNSITIAPRGRLRSEGTFTFCKGGDQTTAKALNLFVTGLGRLATDTDGDNIVEGVDSKKVTCN